MIHFALRTSKSGALCTIYIADSQRLVGYNCLGDRHYASLCARPMVGFMHIIVKYEKRPCIDIISVKITSADYLAIERRSFVQKRSATRIDREFVLPISDREGHSCLEGDCLFMLWCATAPH